MKLLSVHDSFRVEVMAGYYAIQFARDLGFRRINIEGDALSIIKGLTGMEDDLLAGTFY